MTMKYWMYPLGLILPALLVATYVPRPGHVFRFESMEAERTRLDLWRQKLVKNSNSRLTTFKYNNCADPAREVANITNFVLSPDPLVFPGTLTVDFAGTSRITVASPITVVATIQVKVAGNWIKIPCVGQIGSCTYEDVCQLLSQITECPAPFISAGIPCKCPFPQGAYNLSQAEFEVEVPVFPPGDYHAVANITNGGNYVACVELYVTFS